jgi:hypothetical protein
LQRGENNLGVPSHSWFLSHSQTVFDPVLVFPEPSTDSNRGWGRVGDNSIRTVNSASKRIGLITVEG